MSSDFLGTPTLSQGLAAYESDYFAVLGIPITADTRLIRKGYLRVAKFLHPDCYIDRPEQKPHANWLFSKLISPASEVLTRERERAEYREVLRLRVKRLINQPKPSYWPQSHFADQLIAAPDRSVFYYDMVLKLAESQYSNLDKALEATEELSKLNLAYLLLEGGYKVAAPNSAPPVSRPPATSFSPTASPKQSPPVTATPQPTTPSPTAASSSTTSPPPAARTVSSAATEPEPAPAPNPGETRYKQAQQMMRRGQYKEAIQFLGFAIAADTTNADYYYQRGSAYLKLKNTMRARQDLQKALSLDPGHKDAAKQMKALQSSARPTPGTADNKAGKKSSAQQSSTPKKGNLFGRFFDR